MATSQHNLPMVLLVAMAAQAVIRAVHHILQRRRFRMEVNRAREHQTTTAHLGGTGHLEHRDILRHLERWVCR